MEEIIAYYKSQGAPTDQNALVALLREIQQQHGGIPMHLLGTIAEALHIKESYLLAITKRFPSLRLQNIHCLELCAGPNCSKAADLAAYAETLQSSNLQVKFVGCMRMCGKGPNIRYDGQLYHKADKTLLSHIIK